MSEQRKVPEENVRKVWHAKHRDQTITTASVLGWACMAVAAWRFLNWPETGPSQSDAIVTAGLLVFGGSAALPKVAMGMASLAVQLWPWGTNKDHKDD